VVAYRARLRADGSFAGVVAVGLNLASFEAFLDRIDAGERGVVAVRRSDDSRLVMRRPAAPARINTADPWIPPYRMILDGKRRGVVRYASAVDDVDRIFAFQALQDYPFFVIVGRSVDEQFTVWRRTGVAAMAIAAATLTLLLAMQAGLRRSRARLARSEQDFDALVESRREASSGQSHLHVITPSSSARNSSIVAASMRLDLMLALRVVLSRSRFIAM